MPNQNADKEFLEKLEQVVKDNLGKESFGVSELAQELGMSRSNLHRKVDSISKTTVSQYIRQARLKKAKDLLRQTSDTVSEVAYKVGFNSPSYFIKCFGDFYGYPPGQVGDREEEKEESVPEKSILVLPFENISPDPDQEYFCDGLTEEIITDLSYIHDLLVISRSSAMTFKGTRKKITEIANDVNVRYVLEGSVRKAGNNIRIVAQLIEAENDAHLWAEKYNGILDDIFEIQENVSRSIAEALKIKLTPQEDKQIYDRPIDNIKAYECYLKALNLSQRPNEANFEKALEELKTGIAIVGDNALLLAGIGTVYCNYYELGIKVSEEILLKAEAYAFRVLKLAPESSFSYSLLGRIERFRGNAIKALNFFQQALNINPNEPEALFWSGFDYTGKIGRPKTGIYYITKLIEIEPLSPQNYVGLGVSYFMDLNFEDALNSFKKSSELYPTIIA
ncbi:MAG: helix-turn-helix domain-containing protein, partial [Draconibacterium sp.]|nr:helix-turn-helix domain-containing protein [Draconibacterium sp.]